jgi:hypothetical protein
VLIDHDAGMRRANELGELALAVFDWCPSQILALELDQVEGAQYRRTAIARPADPATR